MTKPLGDPLDDDVGRTIRTMPGLSGEDKLAWAYLRKLTGWRFGIDVEVRAKDIGNDQGTSSDAGQNRIRNLKRHRLLRVRSAPKSGSTRGWVVSLIQPRIRAEETGFRAENSPESSAPTPSVLEQLVSKFDAEPGKSKNEIAREMCGGDSKRAQSLLRTYRNHMRRRRVSARGN